MPFPLSTHCQSLSTIKHVYALYVISLYVLLLLSVTPSKERKMVSGGQDNSLSSGNSGYCNRGPMLTPTSPVLSNPKSGMSLFGLHLKLYHVLSTVQIQYKHHCSWLHWEPANYVFAPLTVLKRQVSPEELQRPGGPYIKRTFTVRYHSVISYAKSMKLNQISFKSITFFMSTLYLWFYWLFSF